MRPILILLISCVAVIGLSAATKFYPTEVTFTVLGALLGLLLAQAAQSLLKADLGIEILDDAKNSIGSAKADRYKFLHVVVTNRPSRLKKALGGEHMAMFCQADVDFLDASRKHILFTVDGRWSSTGEPRALTDRGPVFDFAKIPALRFDHIAPGKAANLAIAIKNEGEDSFYGFSNMSYAFARFDHPDWQIQGESAPVRVTVVAGNGERLRKSFVIHNPDASLAKFRLTSR